MERPVFVEKDTVMQNPQSLLIAIEGLFCLSRPQYRPATPSLGNLALSYNPSGVWGELMKNAQHIARSIPFLVLTMAFLLSVGRGSQHKPLHRSIPGKLQDHQTKGQIRA